MSALRKDTKNKRKTCWVCESHWPE